MQEPGILKRSLLSRISPGLLLIVSYTVLFSLLPSSGIFAQGDLMIMPKRIVFENGKKLSELNLANTGKDTARYVISIVHYKMKQDGSFEEILTKDSNNIYADKFIRFFPRSVTLGPNESQSIRIQLVQTGKLMEGEYRTHLCFRAVPKQLPLGEREKKNTDTASISVRLIPVFGISIPVIIRVGECTSKVGLAKCYLESSDVKNPQLNMTLLRTGNMSVYGDITIDHISMNGKVTKVGHVQGLALYTPNTSRNIKIALNVPEGLDFTKGKLHIVYNAQVNGNSDNITQTELNLN